MADETQNQENQAETPAQGEGIAEVKVSSAESPAESVTGNSGEGNSETIFVDMNKDLEEGLKEQEEEDKKGKRGGKKKAKTVSHVVADVDFALHQFSGGEKLDLVQKIEYLIKEHKSRM